MCVRHHHGSRKTPVETGRFAASCAAAYWTILQGDRSPQVFKASAAHEAGLSVWQALQALGIFMASLIAGVTKRKVWLRTFTSPSVCAILGMWQAMHWLPSLSGW